MSFELEKPVWRSMTLYGLRQDRITVMDDLAAANLRCAQLAARLQALDSVIAERASPAQQSQPSED